MNNFKLFSDIFSTLLSPIIEILRWIRDICKNRQINLKNCEGFCIGEHKADGCVVKFDNITKEIYSRIDYNKTEAEICSVVIFTGELDASKKYRLKKHLCFELKTSDSISKIKVECRLTKRDVRLDIVTFSDWKKYCIALPDFGGVVGEWKCLSEIKFLMRRSEHFPGGEIWLRNMFIE